MNLPKEISEYLRENTTISPGGGYSIPNPVEFAWFVINTMKEPLTYAEYIGINRDERNKDIARLLILAIKWCDIKHHDWEEIKRLTKKLAIIVPKNKHDGVSSR